jgi:hypothetical protein
MFLGRGAAIAIIAKRRREREKQKLKEGKPKLPNQYLRDH